MGFIRDMKRRLVIASCVALLILGAGAFAIAYPRIGQSICEARDGRWGSALNECITRACYQDHTCGHWTNPTHRCDRLKPNAPISEVYFQLGEPDRIEHGRHLWVAGKMSTQHIVATFSQDKLASLNIETDPAYRTEVETTPAACHIGPQP